MCPEFERVERIVQLMVDANEKVKRWNHIWELKDGLMVEAGAICPEH